MAVDDTRCFVNMKKYDVQLDSTGPIFKLYYFVHRKVPNVRGLVACVFCSPFCVLSSLSFSFSFVEIDR